MTCLQLLDTCYSITFLLQLLKKVEIISVCRKNYLLLFLRSINAVCISGLISVRHFNVIFGVHYMMLCVYVCVLCMTLCVCMCVVTVCACVMYDIECID